MEQYCTKEEMMACLTELKKITEAEVAIFIPEHQADPVIICEKKYDHQLLTEKEFIESFKAKDSKLFEPLTSRSISPEKYSWCPTYPDLKYMFKTALARPRFSADGQLILISSKRLYNVKGLLIQQFTNEKQCLQPEIEESNLKYYQDIVNNSSDLIVVTDFDGILKSVNPAFRRTLLWGEKELLSKIIWDLVHPNDLKLLSEASKKLNSRNTSHTLKARFKTKKNDYVLLEWHMKLDIANRLIYGTGTNLTQIEKADSDLKLAKSMLEETNRIALIGGWEFNAITNELTWTSVTKEIHEVPEDFEPQLDGAINFYPEGKNRQEIERLMTRATRFNKPYDVELEIISAKGNRKWVRAKGQPVFENKKCVRVIGTIQDINKEKKSQIELESLNTNIRGIMEAGTEVAIIAMDIHGTITYFNSGAEIMLGYSAAEVVGKHTPVIFHNPMDLIKKSHELESEFDAEIKPGVDCLTYRAKQNVSDTQEYTYICRDNSEISVEASITPVKNDFEILTGYVLIGLDVTEKKERESKLQDSENRFRLFFDTSQVILYTHDLDGNFLSMNPKGCYLLGYNEDELLGRNLLDILPMETKKSLNNYLKELKSKGKSKGLMQIMNRDQKKVTWMYHNVVAEDTDGTKYVIGNVTDITDRINLEDNLKSAKRDAEQNARMKEMFLANMSHEIRTPMNAITGFGRLLSETKNLDSEQREYVSSINMASSILLDLINDILDFSKIHSGQIKIEKIPFSLEKQIDHVWKILQPSAERKGLQFKFLIEPDIPDRLMGDPTRISQVLVNLLNNAIKFTEQGHIRLYVEKDERQKDKVTVNFEIQDTGIGIPEDKLENIFDRFIQANSSTTRKYGGTGLGLSITKSLVELQGGEITVNSTENKGSTFKFSLPFDLAEESDSNSNSVETEDIVFERQLKVLLVEDNIFNQKLAEKVLESKGINVDIAENGLLAIERVGMTQYDLVLMDLQMPEMDGYETTMYIRNEMRSTIPIMAMTAHSLVGEKEKCINIGMDDYITKPFEQEELFRKIKNLTVEVPDEPLLRQQDEPEIELDLSYLKSLSDEDKSFEKEILETSLVAIPEELEKLNDAVVKMNAKKVSEIAHKLKSTFMTVGIDAKAELDRLEYDNIEVYQDLENLYYSVKHKYATYRKAIKKELDTNYNQVD
ncbi:PAS domain S-box protein [Jiulongibacter sp. NS-SX5]|uniref:PAS domain S-box protein n=1 Tax=Jiulongibacter sp. NS-SX5 TaxID=3463854 RepID=UPI00405943F2